MNPNFGYSTEDKQLVDKILRGDDRAFALLIRNTESLVAQIVFKMVPVAEDRKDLAQDIYLKVFHHLGGFKFQSKLSTWIAQIAYNTCFSWIDKKKLLYPGDLHEEELIPVTGEKVFDGKVNSSPSEEILVQKEMAGILKKEVDHLPVLYKTLITLFHHESMSYEELSQITGLPEGTVKSSLFRARKMLKENLLTKYKKEAL